VTTTTTQPTTTTTQPTTTTTINTRFTDNGNGTVTDKRTGLRWLKNANAAGVTFTWDDATAAVNNLKDGVAGLSDGSRAGDWHLPTKEELQGIGTDPPATWATGLPACYLDKAGSTFYERAVQFLLVTD
jgi:hypothetical protein